MGKKQEKANEKRNEEPPGTKCIGRGASLSRGVTAYVIQARNATYEKFHPE